jgi:hypothetical protein
MQIRLKSVAIAAVAAGTLSLAVIPIAGQQAPSPAGLSPSTAGVARMDGKPNLSGIWQAFNTANWDILAHEAQAAPRPALQMGAWGAQPGGLGIVEGNELPYRPEALEKKKRNFENRMTVKVANDPSRYDSGDPELQCYRPGVPRANYMPFPFQIFQNREQIMIVYEYKWSVRWIYMDVKSEAPVDSWMGWSNGRWDGDTLVVDVTGMNEYTWFDRAGNFHSDAVHVTERWTPSGPNHLLYEATIDDPKVFTRPWKMSFPIYRRLEPNLQLVEFNCVPFVEEMMYDPLGLYRPGPRKAK